MMAKFCHDIELLLIIIDEMSMPYGVVAYKSLSRTENKFPFNETCGMHYKDQRPKISCFQSPYLFALVYQNSSESGHYGR